MVTAAISTAPRVRSTSDELRPLVLAAAAGDGSAFARLYERYAVSVFNMILRSVRHREAAEDIAQDVWLKAHRELARLREPLAFPAWLYRIAAKMCVDAARKRIRAPQLAELSDQIPASSDDPEATAMAGYDAQLARESLALLPAHQHLALFLREVDERSYREISHILGISDTAVGLCLLRARRSFARTYEQMEHADPQERCNRMQINLSRVIDGEATPVQRGAVNGHLDACVRCRNELDLMRVASRKYAGLALMPVPAAVSAKILGSIGVGAAGSGAAGLLGSLIAKLKMTLLGLLAAGGAAAGVTVGPMAVPAMLGGLADVRSAPLISHMFGSSDTAAASTVTSSAPEAASAPPATALPLSSSIVAIPAVAVETLVPQSASLSPLTSTSVALQPLTSGVATAVGELEAAQSPSLSVPSLPAPDLTPLPAPLLAIPTVTVDDLTIP